MIDQTRDGSVYFIAFDFYFASFLFLFLKHNLIGMLNGVVQKRRMSRDESRHHGKGQDGRNQCLIFAFLLSPMRGK